jgi:hypothetical protein
MELVWFEFEESGKRGEGRSHRSFNYRGPIVVLEKYTVLGLKWCDQQQKRYPFCHFGDFVMGQNLISETINNNKKFRFAFVIKCKGTSLRI